jgi:hypothetical protein
VDEILAVFIQAGCETQHFEIYRLINYTWNEEEMPEQWKESVSVPTYKKGDKTSYSN